MWQQAGNEAWTSKSEASAHMTLTSIGMTKYRKCKTLVSVADGRSLKIVDFVDIAAVFRFGESMLLLKLYNVAHVPKICYDLFSHTVLLQRGHGFTGDQRVIAVWSEQSKRPTIFEEECGNLYNRPQRRGRQCTGWRVTGEDARAFAVAGVTFCFEGMCGKRRFILSGGDTD